MTTTSALAVTRHSRYCCHVSHGMGAEAVPCRGVVLAGGGACRCISSLGVSLCEVSVPGPVGLCQPRRPSGQSRTGWRGGGDGDHHCPHDLSVQGGRDGRSPPPSRPGWTAGQSGGRPTPHSTSPHITAPHCTTLHHSWERCAHTCRSDTVVRRYPVAWCRPTPAGRTVLRVSGQWTCE